MKNGCSEYFVSGINPLSEEQKEKLWLFIDKEFLSCGLKEVNVMSQAGGKYLTINIIPNDPTKEFL